MVNIISTVSYCHLLYNYEEQYLKCEKNWKLTSIRVFINKIRNFNWNILMLGKNLMINYCDGKWIIIKLLKATGIWYKN